MTPPRPMLTLGRRAPSPERAVKAAKINLEIPQGRTFSKVLRWGQPRLAYRQISAATRAAPCVLSVTGHGIPDGYLFKISDVRGMTELNSDERLYAATVLGPDQIELNDVNASSFTAYSGGGVITYNLPVDLTGYTAEMQVRASVTSAEPLLTLSTTNGGIVIDPVANTITLQATAMQTAGITWESGVYDVEMRSAGGIVTALAAGAVKVIKEITR